MEMPKLKSQSPKTYDNTEEDLILAPPAVLDNKMRDFENYQQARGSIFSDIALAITLLVTILATDFKDILPPIITGAKIHGVFIAGFIGMLVKIGFSLFKIFREGDQHGRLEIINSLRKVDDKRDSKHHVSKTERNQRNN